MALGCMEHRGGCSADNDSGDGAGLLTNVPWELFRRDLPDLKEAHTGCAASARLPIEMVCCRLPSVWLVMSLTVARQPSAEDIACSAAMPAHAAAPQVGKCMKWLPADLIRTRLVTARSKMVIF